MSAAPTQQKKIAVIKLGALGDLIMASAFFGRLREHFAGARITLFCGRSSAAAVADAPWFDEIVWVDDGAFYCRGPWARLRESWRILSALRARQFDAAFMLHRSWAFNALLRLSGIPERIGFDRNGEGSPLTIKAATLKGRNEREAYLDLLRAANIPVSGARESFPVNREHQQYALEFLERCGVRAGERLIAIAPGGGKNVKTFMPAKRWPLEHYRELTGLLLARTSCRVVLVGSEDERGLIQAIRELHPSCLDTAGLNLSQAAAVLAHCSLFIGNDSAPLHLAAAAGTPTLAFYGPTDPQELAPPGPGNAALYKAVECSPCYDQGVFPACEHIKCLRSITVEEAWLAAQKQLAAPRQHAITPGGTP